MAISDTYATIAAILERGELVIPDMQRDYCWGTGPAERVTAYISSIAYLYSQCQEDTPTMGQIYGYTYPAGSHRLCVIDGQQRITTLYLLLGMLYRRVPSDGLRRMLIGADGQPRLAYQARREAQYFLTDLTRHFFLNRDGRLSQLERSPWFYKDYESDPTIVSIIGAIRLIDEVLERAASTIAAWDFARFTQFVTQQMRFVVCDLGSRAEAERFFVTLNTTGEPLTPPQRLRPAIEQTDSYDGHVSDELYVSYNEMEDWFWSHRDQSLSVDTTGDSDMLAFMHVFALWHGPFDLLQNNNPFEITHADLTAAARDGLQQLCTFFDLYKRVMSTSSALDDPLLHQAIDGSIESNALLFRLMPCIALVNKFGDEISENDIDRMWQYLANITRYQRTTATDWQAAVETVGMMATSDTLSLLKIRNASKRVVTDEARSALQFITEHRSNRQRVEQLIHRAQVHPALNGRTAAIIEWSGRSIERLEWYIDGLYQIFCTAIDEQPRLDMVRRALLTLGYREYPLVRRGNSVMSLCWQDYDWQRLVVLCPTLLRRLIDYGHNNGLQAMVDDFDDKSYPYYFLIKDGRLMSQIERRQFLKPCKPFTGLPVGENDTIWYVDQQTLIDTATLRAHGWSMVRAYGARCLYTDHLTRNVAIDIYYQPDERSPYRIEVFSRPDVDPVKRRGINIKPMLAASGLTFRFDRDRRRFYTYVGNTHAMLATFGRLVKQITEM